MNTHTKSYERGPLDARMVIRAALSVYRSHTGLVIGFAVPLFGLAAVIDTIADAVASERVPGHVDAPLLTLLGGPVSASSAALVFFAGTMDRLMGHHLYGHVRPRVFHTLRTLPLLRLLSADAGFIAVVALGWALGIVPGLVLFTLWCLIGPVINIEDRGVLHSFGRSAELVRRHFWLTLILVTIPAVLENMLLHGFHFMDADRPLAAAFAVSALIGVTAGATIGLVEVALAHALIGSESGDRGGKRSAGATVNDQSEHL
ncbi:MAG: hypothetical protein ACRDKF_05085 [Actinomycetota bacterium]